MCQEGCQKEEQDGGDSTAWKSCVEDVQVVGGDEKTKKEVEDAAVEEEKDDDKTEDETDDDKKKDAKQQKDDEKAAAKDRGSATAPIVEVCQLGAGADCKDDKGFTEVVALPQKSFDRKEWNTIKVILPAKKGDRVMLRFRQKETSCECCEDWGVDSLQFLTGDECGKGAINEA